LGWYCLEKEKTRTSVSRKRYKQNPEVAPKPTPFRDYKEGGRRRYASKGPGLMLQSLKNRKRVSIRGKAETKTSGGVGVTTGRWRTTSVVFRISGRWGNREVSLYS